MKIESEFDTENTSSAHQKRRFINVEPGVFLGVILLLIGFGCALLMSDGAVSIYFSTASLFIVIFGSLGAVSLSLKLSSIKTAFRHSRHAFTRRTFDIESSIDTCFHLANLYRKKGVLSLEDEPIDDPYIEHCVNLMLDGYDNDTLQSLLNKEIVCSRQRHEKTTEVLELLGETTPALGMIGTLIGLVAMLSGLTTPETIGKGMAVALLTTLYGAVLANCIINPMARRMSEYADELLLHQYLVRDAVLKIARQEPPRAIFEFLQTYIESHKRRSMKELRNL